MTELIPLSSAKADHYAKLRARLAVQKASEHEAIAAIDELCRDNERLALRSQASVAAALEAAAKEHDAEIVRLEAQIIENKNYLRLVGKSERSSANDFCNTAIGHHRGSAVRLRDLITPAQHDALAAHVAAEVAKARAEDAATVLRYRPTGENAKHFVDVLVCDIANEILTGKKAK